MKIRVNMKIDGQPAAEDVLEIDDYKLEELTEEELESAIDVVVRTWASDKIEIAWETEEAEEENP